MPIDLTGIGGWMGAQDALRDYIAQTALRGAQERQQIEAMAQLGLKSRAQDVSERNQGLAEQTYADAAAQREAALEQTRANTGHIGALTENTGVQTGRLRTQDERDIAGDSRKNQADLALTIYRTQAQQDAAARAQAAAAALNQANIGSREKIASLDRNQGGGNGVIRAGVDENNNPVYLQFKNGVATTVPMVGGGVAAPGRPMPAGLTATVTTSQNLAKNLDDLGPLFQKVEAHTGPLMGRATDLVKNVPGVPRNADDAALDASLSVIKNDIIRLVTGAAVRKDEETRILGEVPTRYDKPEDREAKRLKTAQNARDLMGIIQSRYDVPGGTVLRQPGGGAGAGGGETEMVWDPVSKTVKPAGKQTGGGG